MTDSLNAFADALSPAFRENDPACDHKAREAANVACVQAFYRAVAVDDFAAVRACLTPDIAFELLGVQGFPKAGAAGIEEVMAQIEANFSAISSEEAVIETMVAQGDMLMAVARDRGHFKQSGAPYHLQLLMHYTLREGRICYFRQWLFPLE